MTIPDFIAQATILLLILAALWHRDMLADMTDGNVDRIEREEAQATEAQGWLDLMEVVK